VLAELQATPGVDTATVVYRNPTDPGFGPSPGFMSCADLARTPAYGRCPAGAQVSAVDPFRFRALPSSPAAPPPARSTVWPAAAVSVESLHGLPVLSVLVDTDGSRAALERSRTILEAAYPGGERTPATEADFQTDSNNTLNKWQQLANVVILTSLPIAGCSLAVSIAGGLSDRRRPFSLLRLTGVPLRVLRRVIVLESAVPLLVGAVVAIGTGFLAAQLFLQSQEHYSLRAPGVGYYAVVLAGLAASLGIIASTLPVLRRITGPETARNE
jgi:hypothetical protein